MESEAASHQGASWDFWRLAQGIMGKAKNAKKLSLLLYLCVPTAENPKNGLGTKQGGINENETHTLT